MWYKSIVSLETIESFHYFKNATSWNRHISYNNYWYISARTVPEKKQASVNSVYMVISLFFSWSTQFVILKYMWTIILTQTLNLTLCGFFENTIYVIGFLRQFDKYWKFPVVFLMTLSRPTWILFMWLVDIGW